MIRTSLLAPVSVAHCLARMLMLLLTCLWLAAPAAHALQDDDGDSAENALGSSAGRDDQEAQPAADADLPPAEPIPELSAAKNEKLKRAVKKLRNDSDKHRHAAEADVIAFGRSAIPQLLDASTTDHEAMQDAILSCLAAVADINDRAIVAEQFGSERPLLRRFAAREAGESGLAALLDKLPPLLEDDDESVRLEAALALVANGREDGLGIATLAYTGPAKERVLAALPGVAGKGDHAPVAQLMVIDPKREKRDPEGAAQERLAAVQILHAIADPAAVRLLVRALDDKHNVVQRASIDALRALLEDKPPLETSSIFQQINEVKRLKEVAAERR
ncbi:MAG: HEAT repeat domain-containing protein [Planctomycetota bacterium]|jgi:HEAT repeat protein